MLQGAVCINMSDAGCNILTCTNDSALNWIAGSLDSTAIDLFEDKWLTPIAAKQYAFAGGHFSPFQWLHDTDDKWTMTNNVASC